MKKRIIKIAGIVLAIVLVFFSWYQYKWIEYVVHLGKHQWVVITHATSIREALQKQPANSVDEKKDQNRIVKLKKNVKPKFTDIELIKIKLIIRTKNFALKLYELDNSSSYEQWVDLERETLGWNLTVAHPLRMEAVEFSFPFIGNFSYLGFFNQSLLNEWVKFYKSDDYDTYTNEISAYSTLRFFSDPVFNTYTNYSHYGLISMILHELSHEKLYFNTDSSFSERLSSFIEEVALGRYIQEITNDKSNFTRQILLTMMKRESPKKQLFDKERKEFINTLLECKEKLITLYESKHSDEYKFKQKNNLYSGLQKNLIKLSKRFRALKITKNYTERKLNNAVLLQVSRYNPKKKSFRRLLKMCNQNISCWFNRLEKLRKCSNKDRSLFVDNPQKISLLLKNCNKN